MLVLDRKVAVSSVSFQIWKNWPPVLMLVLERKVAIKSCYTSSMNHLSPVHMLVLMVSSVTRQICKTGHQYSCWC